MTISIFRRGVESLATAFQILCNSHSLGLGLWVLCNACGCGRIIFITWHYVLQNSFGLLATVWDNDGGRIFDIGGSSDKIDVINFRTSNAPVTTSWTSAKISGRRSTINLRYRVRCDPYWYRSCTVYCKPQNNYLGHYICASNGNKICNIGWKGANCDQRQHHCLVWLVFRDLV